MDNIYVEYYRNQAGGALPHFRGMRVQRGGKFFLGRAFHSFLQPIFHPLVKAVGKYLGKQALQGAVSTGQGILEGKPFKESAKTAFKTVGKKVAQDALTKLLQAGSGASRKRKAVGRLKEPPAKRRRVAKTKTRKKGITGATVSRSRPRKRKKKNAKSTAQTINSLHKLANVYI